MYVTVEIKKYKLGKAQKKMKYEKNKTSKLKTTEIVVDIIDCILECLLTIFDIFN